MTAPAIIQDLVNRFRDSRELYRSGRYNEAQLRQEFLNPLFEALGWDMYNRSNFAPQYREVIHEDSLEDQGSVKAPDYAFRIGTTRKFFVEAKKPAVDIRYDIHPAYQLRRYAWNAHLPLSILTDFEELAVYDCRTRPDPGDSAATGRVMLFSFEEYLTRWDELARTFSKDAVWNGSFDRYAEGSKGKRGTTEVDAEFLKEIEQWRLLLARNIALRNFRPSSNPVIASEAKQSQPASEAKQSQPASEAKQSRSASEAKQSQSASEAKQSQSASEAKQSPNLHRAERQLNYAVQTTIDRILFLRICEDRKIEPTDQLLQIGEGSDIYAQLLLLFQKADQKYNSGLFHFNKEKGQTSDPDTFTPTLQIDDKVLRQIIKSTYYPCPYMFNEIPVEILGQVYEQFLGSVIRLTPGGQAKVEEKPEVRKAGGVYYTPSYIVDYIVQNTLGRLLGDFAPVPEIVPVSSRSTPPPKAGVGVPSTESDRQVSTSPIVPASNPSPIVPASTPSTGTDRQVSTSPTSKEQLTPAQALNLRVVDPACGSGSFLLGAYQYLLDWHLNYYLSHDPQSHTRGKNPSLVATEGGEYRLTTETKKRILTSSIYGVDIDAQAVEVTKLSLLLKLLEGEAGQLSFGFERVLPNLDQNIRCGNSLIGWDYFQGQMFPDEEELQRVNPFDWQRAFPHVFAAGGFDAVIGNPPYLSMENMDQRDRDHYYSFSSLGQKRYKTAVRKANLYSIFWELGLRVLKNYGFMGFITPYAWLTNSSFFELRNIFINHTTFQELILLPLGVFKGVGIKTGVLVVEKSSCENYSFNIQDLRIYKPDELEIEMKSKDQLKIININNFDKSSNLVFKFNLGVDEEIIRMIKQDNEELKDHFIVDRGCDTGNNKKYIGDQLITRYNPKQLLDGKSFWRYGHKWDNLYLYYLPEKMKRENSRARPGESERFEVAEKIILYRFLTKQSGMIATLDRDQFYCLGSTYVIRNKRGDDFPIELLLAILNSKLLAYFNKSHFQGVKVTLSDLHRLPIVRLNKEDPGLSQFVTEIVFLVNERYRLNEEGVTPNEISLLSRRKVAIEERLNLLIYQIYKLNDDSIDTIESYFCNKSRLSQ